MGRIGGKQRLNLGLGCAGVGIALHELLHALGFLHEHNRPDRDNYVIINRANIIQGIITTSKCTECFLYNLQMMSDSYFDFTRYVIYDYIVVLAQFQIYVHFTYILFSINHVFLPKVRIF